MERFALSRMKEWKENENRKPLIIRGARQVGKTWIMKTFGQQYFEKTAYVNFDNNARMKQVFEGDLDIERLVLAISAETGVYQDFKGNPRIRKQSRCSYFFSPPTLRKLLKSFTTSRTHQTSVSNAPASYRLIRIIPIGIARIIPTTLPTL